MWRENDLPLDFPEPRPPATSWEPAEPERASWAGVCFLCGAQPGARPVLAGSADPARLPGARGARSHRSAFLAHAAGLGHRGPLWRPHLGREDSWATVASRILHRVTLHEDIRQDPVSEEGPLTHTRGRRAARPAEDQAGAQPSGPSPAPAVRNLPGAGPRVTRGWGTPGGRAGAKHGLEPPPPRPARRPASKCEELGSGPRKRFQMFFGIGRSLPWTWERGRAGGRGSRLPRGHLCHLHVSTRHQECSLFPKKTGRRAPGVGDTGIRAPPRGRLPGPSTPTPGRQDLSPSQRPDLRVGR